MGRPQTLFGASLNLNRIKHGKCGDKQLIYTTAGPVPLLVK